MAKWTLLLALVLCVLLASSVDASKTKAKTKAHVKNKRAQRSRHKNSNGKVNQMHAKVSQQVQETGYGFNPLTGKYGDSQPLNGLPTLFENNALLLNHAMVAAQTEMVRQQQMQTSMQQGQTNFLEAARAQPTQAQISGLAGSGYAPPVQMQADSNQMLQQQLKMQLQTQLQNQMQSAAMSLPVTGAMPGANAFLQMPPRQQTQQSQALDKKAKALPLAFLQVATQTKCHETFKAVGDCDWIQAEEQCTGSGIFTTSDSNHRVYELCRWNPNVSKCKTHSAADEMAGCFIADGSY